MANENKATQDGSNDKFRKQHEVLRDLVFEKTNQIIRQSDEGMEIIQKAQDLLAKNTGTKEDRVMFDGNDLKKLKSLFTCSLYDAAYLKGYSR